MLHRAVREGWPSVAAAASGRGGLPKRVQEEVRRYLQCGVLRYGFVQTKCESCEESVLVAFSCKARGWCPSCGARRGHEAAAHLLDLLPEVGYRQWTLSLPHSLRWVVVKDAKLLRRVERCLVRAIFRLQRRRAKALGVDGKPKGGAVSFVQMFNSALGLQPHLHLLLPEGVFADGAFVELPPPRTEEVEVVLARVVHQLKRVFEGMEAPWPEDGFEALQAEGAQLQLRLEDRPQRGRTSPVAGAMGFSLHAGTWVHGNDREGLARLARYGARGPVAESRLSRREDGKYVYQTKRGVVLVLTAAQLVKRLLWLIPPARMHLVSFHGVFASHAKERATVTRRPEATGEKVTPPLLGEAAREHEVDAKPKRPRLDWATLQQRTWGADV